MARPDISGTLLTGLYGFWPFDEPSGTRACTLGTGPDLSESGSVPAHAGRYGLAIGSTEADTCQLIGTTSVAVSAGLTFAFCFKWPPYSSGLFKTMAVLGTDPLAAQTEPYIYVGRYYDSDYLDLYFAWPTGQQINLPLPRLGNFEVGTWHLLVITYNPTTGVFRGRVDDGCLEGTSDWGALPLPALSLSATVPAAQLSAANTASFDRISFLKGINGVNFEGWIDSALIWTRVLTDAEIEDVWDLFRPVVRTEIQRYEPVVQEDLNIGTEMTWIESPAGGKLRATQTGIHSFARGQKQSQTPWTPGTIAAGGYTDTNISVPDAVIGDFVMVSHTSLSTNGLRLLGHCQEPGNVHVFLHNPTAASVTVAAGTLSALAFSAANINGLPEAAFTNVAVEGGIVGEGIIQFTDATDGGLTPYVWAWNFGDGVTSTEQSPQHTYSQGGGANPQTFTATLTVTDDLGVVDSVSALVTVTFNT